jgi:hypothetical protein
LKHAAYSSYAYLPGSPARQRNRFGDSELDFDRNLLSDAATRIFSDFASTIATAAMVRLDEGRVGQVRGRH